MTWSARESIDRQGYLPVIPSVLCHRIHTRRKTGSLETARTMSKLKTFVSHNDTNTSDQPSLSRRFHYGGTSVCCNQPFPLLATQCSTIHSIVAVQDVRKIVGSRAPTLSCELLTLDPAELFSGLTAHADFLLNHAKRHRSQPDDTIV